MNRRELDRPYFIQERMPSVGVMLFVVGVLALAAGWFAFDALHDGECFIGAATEPCERR